jgi:hypothetical protein
MQPIRYLSNTVVSILKGSPKSKEAFENECKRIEDTLHIENFNIFRMVRKAWEYGDFCRSGDEQTIVVNYDSDKLAINMAIFHYILGRCIREVKDEPIVCRVCGLELKTQVCDACLKYFLDPIIELSDPYPQIRSFDYGNTSTPKEYEAKEDEWYYGPIDETKALTRPELVEKFAKGLLKMKRDEISELGFSEPLSQMVEIVDGWLEHDRDGVFTDLVEEDDNFEEDVLLKAMELSSV